MDKDEAGEATLPIGPPIINEPLLVQPKTTHIPDLNNETSLSIIKLKATMRVKKRVLTATVNEAVEIKRKLVKKLDEGELRLDSYEAQASVLIMKGKAIKINSLLDVLDESIMTYEVVLEECKMQYQQTEAECDFYLQGVTQEQLKYKTQVEDYHTSNEGFYGQFESPSQTSSRTHSRDSSPRGQRLVFKPLMHMQPQKLKGDCDVRAFWKFKKDFDRWMNTSLLGSTVLPSNDVYIDLVFSVLDSAWTDRLKDFDRSLTKETLWVEIEKWLKGPHPLHMTKSLGNMRVNQFPASL